MGSGSLVPALALAILLVTTMHASRWRTAVLVLGVLLSACTTPQPAPEQTPGIAPVSSPAGAHRVTWGGQLIAVENRRDSTELEVLAFPLDSGGRPDTAAASVGRFVAVQAGFLDPVDYAPGRLVTATGTVGAARTGAVGGAQVRLATLDVQSLRLWPREPAAPRVVPFGAIGIGFGSGGYSGGGLGIGIGF